MIFRDKQNTTYGRVYGSGNGANFGLLDGDGNWSYLAVKDNYTQFRINNSAKMTIKSNGNVGIGTTAPGAKLDVAGTGKFSTINLGGVSKSSWPVDTDDQTLSVSGQTLSISDGNSITIPGPNQYNFRCVGSEYKVKHSSAVAFCQNIGCRLALLSEAQSCSGSNFRGRQNDWMWTSTQTTWHSNPHWKIINPHSGSVAWCHDFYQSGWCHTTGCDCPGKNPPTAYPLCYCSW